MTPVSILKRQAGLVPALVAGLFLLTAPLVAASSGPERVDINTASAVELTTLPGVGPAIAQRIIEYREKNGSFQRTVELMNVKGIGEKTFDRLKDLITVSMDKKG